MQFLANIKFKIGKNDSKWIPYWLEDVEIENSWAEEYPLEDDIDLIAHDSVAGLPEEIKKLTFDQVAVVECEFWGEWTVDYWGEHDANFSLESVKFEIKNYD